jgi:ribonuclease VapC
VIVDASALVAIVRDEPEAERFIDLIAGDQRPAMSAATWLEAAIVIDGRRDPVASASVEQLVATLEIEISPFTVEQAKLARDAYRLFGKGSGHPARLNLGDCFSYALASERQQPLLFKGTDFRLTDLSVVD